MDLPARLPLLNLPVVPFPGVLMEVPARPQTTRLFEHAGQKRLVFAICADSPMAALQGSKVGALAELSRLDAVRFRVKVVARGKLLELESLTPVPVVSWESMPEEEVGDLGWLVGPLLQHAGAILPDELHAFLRLAKVLPENAINLVASRWPLSRAEHQALLEQPSPEARAKSLMARPAGTAPVGQTPLRLRLAWRLNSLVLKNGVLLVILLSGIFLGIVATGLWRKL